MNLHEQYAELVRRGMPEHPRLYPQTRDYTTVVIDKATGKAVNGPVQSEPVCWALACDPDEHHPNDPFIDPDDARGLITMHALEWFRECPWQGFPMFRLELDQAQHWQLLQFSQDDGEWAYETGCNSLLDAILAATEHLGVKG